VQDALWECLQRGQAVRWEKARKLATRLWQQWDGLWTFAQVDGVEPTNNAAKRAVRPAVLWRKGCFGTQSKSLFGNYIVFANRLTNKRIDAMYTTASLGVMACS
jgi:hypothetical protein